MERVIVLESAKNIRAKARKALKNNWQEGCIVAAIFLLGLTIPEAVLNQIAPAMTSLYLILIEGPFIMGITYYVLKLIRNEEHEINDAFFGFGMYGKSLGMVAWEYLWLFIWSLAFTIPMLIITITIIGTSLYKNIGTIDNLENLENINALYSTIGSFGAALLIIAVLSIAMLVFMYILQLRYSMSFFILKDNPDKGIRYALRKSILMMKGNKGKLFSLEISFIGWGILAMIAISIVAGIFSYMLSGSLILEIISAILTSVILAPLFIYMYTAIASFYRILIGEEESDVLIPDQY